MTLRCLIVDDDHQFLRIARRVLEHEGVEVVAVSSTGADALARQRELRPDVALVDVDLGDEDGFDLAARLTGGARCGPSPVIMISARAECDFADMVEDSSALAFLPKTDLSASVIAAILRRHCGDGEAALSGPPGT
ncbi:response regulator [Sphaerisporangium sp. TRM90804]|uniref:response regulator n=1 Tax=Sphaerisporangium sp. TRM90804 TaxID=3031113 RepID=UPI00244A3642|nr:response regulator [Sphaerisporangium sp. TRM90804]MDH2430237.1 response regulator [Sphaerisporangium sp. TRM90804]